MTIYCKNAAGEKVVCAPPEATGSTAVPDPSFNFGHSVDVSGGGEASGFFLQDSVSSAGNGIVDFFSQMTRNGIGKTLSESTDSAMIGIQKSLSNNIALIVPPGLALGTGLINAKLQSSQERAYIGGNTIDNFLKRFSVDGVLSPILLASATSLILGGANVPGLLMAGGGAALLQLAKGKDNLWRNRFITAIQILLTLSLPFFSLNPTSALVAGGVIAVRNMFSNLRISGLNINPLQKEGRNTLLSVGKNIVKDLGGIIANNKKKLLVIAGMGALYAIDPSGIVTSTLSSIHSGILSATGLQSMAPGFFTSALQKVVSPESIMMMTGSGASALLGGDSGKSIGKGLFTSVAAGALGLNPLLANTLGGIITTGSLVKDTQKIDTRRLNNDPDIQQFFRLLQTILSQDEDTGKKSFQTLANLVPFLSIKRIMEMPWDEKKNHFNLAKKDRGQFMQELLNWEGEMGGKQVTKGWNAFLYKRAKNRSKLSGKPVLHMTPNDILNAMAEIGKNVKIKIDPYSTASEDRQNLWHTNPKWVEKVMESDNVKLKKAIVHYMPVAKKATIMHDEVWSEYLTHNATQIKGECLFPISDTDSMASIFNALSSSHPTKEAYYKSLFSTSFVADISSGKYNNKIAEKINLEEIYNTLTREQKVRFLETINADTNKNGLKNAVINILKLDSPLDLTVPKSLKPFAQWTRDFEDQEKIFNPAASQSGTLSTKQRFMEHGVVEIVSEMAFETLKKGWFSGKEKKDEKK